MDAFNNTSKKLREEEESRKYKWLNELIKAREERRITKEDLFVNLKEKIEDKAITSGAIGFSIALIIMGIVNGVWGAVILGGFIIIALKFPRKE
ncbi:MAG: hypothetical protein CO145_01435 [Candidatus Nealsonbacteria bacterium CG_4_9_14_3_um_filter_37_13]|uniref:Uncharacterized protein n=2 Tax=Candidatus Nealsoniibacteriota TaxID=1817911 RepID=A0A2H0TJL8_9BACT|nr:MAG: hypothetical protein COU43_00865 [Candidatus Nealsonbacteria bacterium CG10_big_fil_rev_8_21_14_0_10_37_25]PJA84304.1 MAG: hypothetical protein CO145_01435 [Candidatus Nealsonbacteria bacterium CG_4_9_14_3_um_filter_37_13]